MKTEVVVSNKHYSKTSAITTVTSADGPIATFPYNPSDYASIGQRLLDFARFSAVRQIEVIEVIGDDLII